MDVFDQYSGETIGRDRDMILDRKYYNAPGMRTSRVLLGLDAAIHWRHDADCATIGLVEGVFDAARLGPPFVSMMGLTLKPGQVEALIGCGFKRVLYLCDRDGCDENVMRTRESMRLLKPYFEKVQELELPSGLKDAGEMTPEQAAELRERLGLPG
ncbi:hypothetical protein [Cerasicoccus frondis]|uniref:hypothetical protein n=1 Tax=Cerasicoccus frondis TaxID=490090 RepID=UPI00285288EE|nr:hypothetical protein [Cerasicoccus frondis]